MNFGNLFRGLANFQLPYTINAEPYHSTKQWSLYESYSKKPESNGKKLTVFKPRPDADRDLIMNCVRCVKRIRMPGLCNVVEVIDNNVENIESILIVTDYVQAIANLTEQKLNMDAVCFGIYDLCRVLKLIESKFVIGNLCFDNIYFNDVGEWIIFGLECCFDKQEVERDDYQFYKNLRVYNCDITENYKITDRRCFGKLIIDIFDKIVMNNIRFPKDWNNLVKDSLSNAKISIEAFEKKLTLTQTWKSSNFIMLYEEMKELHIKSDQDRISLIKQFNKKFSMYYMSDVKVNVYVKNFTPGFISNLIIPQVCDCINFMFNDMVLYHDDLVFFLTMLLNFIVEDDNVVESNDIINQIFYKMWRLSDRQIRFILLMYLPKLMIKKIDKKKINFSDKIFSFYLQGLIDSDKNLRLMTLRTIPYIITEITDRQLNNEILRNIAKTQVDPETEIRTETILIIIKISEKLNNLSNRDNVLATIFTKSLKDPNIDTKLASLYGLKECLELFSVEVIANKIMSVIAPGLLDKDKIIRIKAKELFNLYLKKLEKEADEKFSNKDTDPSNINMNEYKFDKFNKTRKEEINEIDIMIKEFVKGLTINSDTSHMISHVTKPSPVINDTAVDNDSGWDDFVESDEDGWDDHW